MHNTWLLWLYASNVSITMAVSWQCMDVYEYPAQQHATSQMALDCQVLSKAHLVLSATKASLRVQFPPALHCAPTGQSSTCRQCAKNIYGFVTKHMRAMILTLSEAGLHDFEHPCWPRLHACAMAVMLQSQCAGRHGWRNWQWSCTGGGSSCQGLGHPHCWHCHHPFLL